MVKRTRKSTDGMYHVSGKKFTMLTGSRASVQHGNAYKTSGGLTKDKLMMNKNGRIVSVKKHKSAKKDNRLVKAGYVTKKGVFGSVKNNGTVKKRKSSRRRR